MNERMRQLEQRRLALVAQSNHERDQLMAFGARAGDALGRLRTLLLVARAAAYLRRLRRLFSWR